VFLTETLPSIRLTGLDARLETVLRQEIGAFRDDAYARVRGVLLSPNFARLIIRLNRWVETRRWLKADQPTPRNHSTVRF